MIGLYVKNTTLISLHLSIDSTVDQGRSQHKRTPGFHCKQCLNFSCYFNGWNIEALTDVDALDT